MDEMVKETQIWLNKTYGKVAGFGKVPENGNTGWDTVYGLTRALQHELGITNLVDNFGPSTAAKWDAQFAGKVKTGFKHNVVKIIQGGFWCKGINPEDFTGEFTTATAAAVVELKKDAGIKDTSAKVNSDIMQALLTMSAFVLVPGGDAKIRSMQQQLNHDYQAYTGILPCDGIYQRDTNTALIYALQAEEGLAVGTANGYYGPATKDKTPTVAQGQTNNFVRILQWGLYANNKTYTGAFDGSYGASVSSAVSSFETTMALNSTSGTSAGLDVFMSLLTSAGNPDRSAIACDTSYQLNASRVTTLKNAGYSIVGRYLTGTVGSGNTERNKNLTATELQAITSAGLSVFPIFQDGASDKETYFTTSRGLSDGSKAGQAARRLGFPTNTVIYFAVDADIQNGDIAGSATPYFKAVQSSVASYGYKTGIYGTRNVSETIIKAGLATKAFVSDMSTGYSGNLGFAIPTVWSFDQFSEISIGDFAIDKVATTQERQTAVKKLTPDKIGTSDDLDKVNKVIQSLADGTNIFHLFKGTKISVAGDIYTVNTLFATITLEAEFEGQISTDKGLASTTYSIKNHHVDFSFDNPVQKVIEENKLAFDPNALLSQISSIGGKIENGSITTTSNISAGEHVLTLRLESSIKHKGSDNTTYDLGYAVTLKIHMHKYTGSSVPVGVTATDVKKYNNNLDNLVNAASNVKQDATNLEQYYTTLLSSALESIPTETEASALLIGFGGGLLLLLAFA
ncbi:glycoside hydrolase domain-containing protein [Pediococcus ethanolidurans]